MTASFPRSHWSLLKTRCLDVPVGKDADHANPTWGVFSEAFDVCLRGVALHVARRVDDRQHLENVVTEVFVENLGVLVSQLGEREKLRRLLVAVDPLIARGASPGPRETSRRARGDRGVTVLNRESDL